MPSAPHHAQLRQHFTRNPIVPDDLFLIAQAAEFALDEERPHGVGGFGNELGARVEIASKRPEGSYGLANLRVMMTEG